jgi:PPOX class probable F420-dependent enzyme
VDLDRARDFLRTHHRAVLATSRADGRPQLSPVLTGIDGEGRVLISTRENAIKTRNVRREPHASLCVLSDSFFGDWIQVEGRAEVVSLPVAMDLLVDYYRAVAGEHPDWADYRAVMERDKRVIIRVAITRAGPDVSG